MNGLLVIAVLTLVGLAAGGVLAFLAWAWQVLFRKDEWIKDNLIYNPDFARDLEGWTEVKDPLRHSPYEGPDPSSEAIAHMESRRSALQDDIDRATRKIGG